LHRFFMLQPSDSISSEDNELTDEQRRGEKGH